MTKTKTKPADEKVTLNLEQELYVIPCSGGYSCLGFDVCLKRTDAIVKWLESEGHQWTTRKPVKRGTLEAYQQYETAMSIASTHCDLRSKRCPVELTPQLIGLEGKRVEVVDAYGETRRFYVGKSTGWMPCHLEISKSNSSGGPAVMGAPFKSVRVIKGSR